MKFLRYPGGKNKLLFFLANLLPQSEKIEGRYIEPFVGGGSVFLYVQPEGAILSDLNEELIDLYKGIRNYPHKVWETFASFPSGKETYYRIRDEEYEDKPLYYRAARTLYLNRTCFNGMWRHNHSGNFNVGYGGEARRWVITHKSIIQLSRRLKKAVILQSDFEPILDQCKDGDFIFVDPPYRPHAKEQSNAHYIGQQFTFADQQRLASTLHRASVRGVSWTMTNSSHPDILDLYRDCNILPMPRGTGRTPGVLSDKSGEAIITSGWW